jgi:hypothetical protein
MRPHDTDHAACRPRARAPISRQNNEAAAAERAVMAQLRLALDIHRRDYFDHDELRRAAE